MNTDNHADSTPHPEHPMQAACPAFTRWMQRRVFKAGAAKSTTKSATKSANKSEIKPEINPVTQGHAIATPPSDEELSVAALQELQQRLRCKNPFLNRFLSLLQQDPVVTTAWITPLPRPDTVSTFAVADTTAKHLHMHLQTQSLSSTQWIRPIDDIWTVALQAARDPALAHHERELAFVVTLVQPLLDGAICRFGFTHDDLSLLERIKAARQACTSDDVADSASGFDTQAPSNDEHILAQAVLLKSLLAPDMIDFEAERIHLLQRDRIWRAVDRAMHVLRVNWSEPEPVKPLARTCLTPQRDTTQSSAQRSSQRLSQRTTQHSSQVTANRRQLPLNRGANR